MIDYYCCSNGASDRGHIETVENYKDGQKDGIRKNWYEDGQLSVEIKYKDGQ